MDDSTKPNDVTRAVDSDLSDGGVDAQSEVVHRDGGVRLRTNIQSGSASERVNVTAEVHARDMAHLVSQLPSYREVLGEQLDWARRSAEVANE